MSEQPFWPEGTPVCGCGHVLPMCHRENARRWCGGSPMSETDQARIVMAAFRTWKQEKKPRYSFLTTMMHRLDGIEHEMARQSLTDGDPSVPQEPISQ